MVFSRMASALVLAGLVTGCASKPKEEPPVVADSLTVSRVRDSLQKMDANARVGQVSEVNTADNTAAVSDILTTDFKEGAIVTFLDGNQKVLTTGKVIRVLPDALHVRYDVPTPPARVPVVGDMAVRFN